MPNVGWSRKFGVKVIVRNFSFQVQVHFPVRSSKRVFCPMCKEWQNKNRKMILRKDLQGNLWWLCTSAWLKTPWKQCGTFYPVGFDFTDPALVSLRSLRMGYLEQNLKQHKKTK